MYTIIGGDQKPYGPISQDQVVQWISEGRANGQTLCQAGGSDLWKPLTSFPEFAAALAATGATGASGIPSPPAIPPPVVSASRTNGLAITGFVLGLLGLTCCGPIVSVLGLIFSCIALTQINKDPTLSGRGLAIAGICLSVLGFITFAILLSSGMYRNFLKNFSIL